MEPFFLPRADYTYSNRPTVNPEVLELGAGFFEGLIRMSRDSILFLRVIHARLEFAIKLAFVLNAFAHIYRQLCLILLLAAVLNATVKL